ncbi:MAG: hypothetical protein ACYTGG_03555 [Planctomycetota bacterium]|jgi:hypothetical protein
MSRHDTAQHDQFPDTDVIIGRLVDAEATPDDRRRFDDLAATEPGLWRLLALRQLDHDLLAEGLDEVTAEARQVDLPAPRLGRRSLAWTIASSGWAAAFVLLVSWAVVTWSGQAGRAAGERLAGDAGAAAPALTPDEHLAAYMQAPFVIGEEAPMLLDTFEHPDGHIELRVMRRIIERIDLEPGRGIPGTGINQPLTTDPANLRDTGTEPGETASDG